MTQSVTPQLSECGIFDEDRHKLAAVSLREQGRVTQGTTRMPRKSTGHRILRKTLVLRMGYGSAYTKSAVPRGAPYIAGA